MGLSCDPPPSIEITSPANGAFNQSASITVNGKVKNINVTNAAVTVNGVPVTVQPDKTWSYNMPLDQSIVFNPVFAELTVISNGSKKRDRVTVIAGEAAGEGEFSLESLVLRINDSGLDQLEPIVEQLAGGALDPTLFISPGQVLISDFCAIDGGFLGCLGSVDVVGANPAPSFGGFGIDADSMNTFLFGRTSISNLEVNVQINGSGLAPSCGLRITASTTNIDGDYDLIPTGSSIDVNLISPIDVSFVNFQDEFTSGLCDFPLIGDLIQLIIGDIRPLVEGGFEDALADPDGGGPLDSPIADGVETALAGIDLAGEIGGLFAGITLEAPGVLPPDDNEVEDPVGLTLAADGRVTVDTSPTGCDAPPTAPDLVASYEVTPGPFPSFGATTPVSGTPYGLGICLSVNAVNQLLKAAIECGLLQIELTELELIPGSPQPITAGLLASFEPAFAGFDPAFQLAIRITPTLAPVLTGNPGPPPDNLLAELRMGGLLFEIVDPVTSTVFVGGVVDVRLGLDVDLVGGQLSAVIGAPDAGMGDITLQIVRETIDVNELLLEALVPFVVAPLFPSLADTLGGFPLPSFVGVELTPVEVSAQDDFLSIYADLNPAP